MRLFIIAMFLFGIAAPLSAQTLKPGTPEWDRHFEELRKKGEALRKQSSRSSLSGSPSKFKSSSSFGSRSTKSDAQRKRDLEALQREAEKKDFEAIPAKYRAAYADALHPAAFDRKNTPSVEVTIKHLQKVITNAKSLEEIIPYLSGPFRQRFILLLAGKNYGFRPHTPEEELGKYKEFFQSISSFENSQASANGDFAYGYVWTESQGSVLYQLEFVGEGKLWRLNGWKAQLSRQ